MKKSLTLVAVSALALATAACGKSENNTSTVSAEDNMLVPADENSMGADLNSTADINTMDANAALPADNAAAGNAM